jgi:hypothetical protein
MRSLALLLLAASAPAAADNAGKALAVAHTDAPPVIDGRLDDPAWARAPYDDRFVQVYPGEGKAPTERTEVRVLYDGAAVYVGVRCHDSAPEQIVARMTRRDRDIDTDSVAVAFDTQQDRRTAYVFQLSAAGVQLDGMFYDDRNLNLDWDAVWDGAVARDQLGWTAEFRIPLSVLRFSDGAAQDWGFQVARTITRKKERQIWAFRPSTVEGEVSWFGRLSGMGGLGRVRAFEVRPFVVARLSGRTSSGGSFFARGGGSEGRLLATPEVGVDAKLGITSRLVLDATANPDFGQVEADQVELNLTRFESFFPEKRPFFLEGADVYQTPLQLFYSRRIGQPPTRLGRGDTVDAGGLALTVHEAQPALRIWSAAKVTGALTRDLSIGLLGAITAAETVEASDEAGADHRVALAPERSFTVLRLRYSLGPGAYLGVLGTAVNRLGGGMYLAARDHDAYTQGVDSFWRSPGGATRVTAQLVLSERVGGPTHQDGDGRPCPDPLAPGCRPLVRIDGTPIGPGAVGFGGASELRVHDGHLIIEGRAESLSRRLDVNDAGFVQRFNENTLRAAAGYNESKPRGHFQSFGLFGFGSSKVTYDGVHEGSVLGIHLEGETRSFFSSQPEVAFVLPGWDVFETGDGARLEKIPGVNPSWSLATDSRNAWRLEGNVSAFLGLGPATATRSVGGSLEASYQVSPRLQLELGPRLGHDWKTLRFHDCVDPAGADCTAGTASRLYHFGRLDSSYLSLTTRGTYTLSPRLTWQWYGQLFLARGAFGAFTEIATAGPHPFIHLQDLRPSLFDGDADHDGNKDRDFQNASLNVNTVLRWELRPGSALYLVYTRAQAADVTLAGRSPRYSLRGLDTGVTEDVLLVKLSYFLR